MTCNIVNNTVIVNTTGSNLHNNTDIDYYKIQLNPGNYTITPRLYESYNGGSGEYYTVDAKFAYSTDGSNWSEYYDDVIDSSIAYGGGTLYFCVMPYFEGKTGTYLLSINVAVGTVYNTVDQQVINLDTNGKKCTQVDLSGLTSGVYVLQAVGHGQTMTRRIVKTE